MREPRILPDQVYSRAGGTDRLADIYLPAGDGPFPVVIFLHGGGWRFGDRRLGPDLSRHFAQQGFAMVSIDYRLSGEAIFPAAVLDTIEAVHWVRSVAGTYGFDPGRIGLWGSSAGGHLAALAGMAPKGTFGAGDPVQAICAGYPPVDFLQMDAQRDPTIQPSDDPESAHLPVPRPVTDPQALESLFLGGAVTEHPKLADEANPCRFARPGLPPLLLMHGTADAAVPIGQSRLLYAAVAAAGSDVTLIEVPGLGHGFFNRTDLDDREPLTLTTICPGAATVTRPGHVFETVASFFARHCVDA
ncbi:alpha/beta fold hydrolase [Nioella sp.]|uniref:alpha/beta fold hydrolase n=1 Tax=Nioella sp. TaxID=1912091 RepID=UPI003518EA0E